MEEEEEELQRREREKETKRVGLTDRCTKRENLDTWINLGLFDYSDRGSC